MKKEKEMAAEEILRAVEAICDDIESDTCAENNKTRAEAIKVLTEAVKDLKY